MDGGIIKFQISLNSSISFIHNRVFFVVVKKYQNTEIYQSFPHNFVRRGLLYHLTNGIFHCIKILQTFLYFATQG